MQKLEVAAAMQVPGTLAAEPYRADLGQCNPKEYGQ